jgi:5'-nucleotidase
MNILLTNDDGIHSEALWLLSDGLAKEHTVTVVAPDRERSAISHGITLQRPLRASRIALNHHAGGFAVSGTPADCVKLALLDLMDARPDLVVAGINPGVNLGVNINYSGTVAAAREAALAGVAAISVSVAGKSRRRFIEAAELVRRLVNQVDRHGLPYGTFLNVNIPDVAMDAVAGVVFSRQGVQRFEEYVEKRKDPRDRLYYWQGLDRQTFENSPDVDGTALSETCISITPIKCDTTDYDLLRKMQDWVLPIPGTDKK